MGREHQMRNLTRRSEKSAPRTSGCVTEMSAFDALRYAHRVLERPSKSPFGGAGDRYISTEKIFYEAQTPIRKMKAPAGHAQGVRCLKNSSG